MMIPLRLGNVARLAILRTISSTKSYEVILSLPIADPPDRQLSRSWSSHTQRASSVAMMSAQGVPPLLDVPLVAAKRGTTSTVFSSVLARNAAASAVLKESAALRPPP